MKDTKFTRFYRLVLESGKIFTAINIIMIPIIWSDAFILDRHIGLKIASFVLLLADYIFLFHIIDKACNASDKVNDNNKKNITEDEDSEEEIIEEYHQMTIDEYLEENKEEVR